MSRARLRPFRAAVAALAATAALAVNMIPHVLKASAGLKTMTELPAPAAMLGDVRHMIADRSWRGA